MSCKHDVSYVKRNTRLGAFFLLSIAMFATGIVVSIPDAEARAGGGGAARAGGGGGAARAGGGGGGRKAQNSVSGANHAASRPSGGSAGNKGGNTGKSGNRGGNAGYKNGDGNRGNGNNYNGGNKINTGNVNIGNDVNIDIDGGHGYGHGGYYHNPIATGIAIGAVAATTAAVLGSSYYALPPSGCANVMRNGIPYYYCGSVYYQQSWSGNDVVYVVVNP